MSHRFQVLHISNYSLILITDNRDSKEEKGNSENIFSEVSARSARAFSVLWLLPLLPANESHHLILYSPPKNVISFSLYSWKHDQRAEPILRLSRRNLEQHHHPAAVSSLDRNLCVSSPATLRQGMELYNGLPLSSFDELKWDAKIPTPNLNP
jgi:hypothetical protein